MSTVTHTEDNGAATITFNAPPLNVWDIPLIDALNGTLAGLVDRTDLSAIVFRAEGKAFSAGVSVQDHLGELAPKMISSFHQVFRALHKCDIPTVCVIHGACLGGAMELAQFCDIVVAADNAKFGQPEIKLGVFPPIACWALPRMLPRQVANDLILRGQVISAAEAYRIGLVSVLAPADQLAQVAAETLTGLTSLSASSLALTKRAIRLGSHDQFDQELTAIETVYLEALMKTHDAQEGLQSFVEKRSPRFEYR
jgi:cyclohexa-1,5-dienecarbonyl-CoA hydratase